MKGSPFQRGRIAACAALLAIAIGFLGCKGSDAVTSADGSNPFIGTWVLPDSGGVFTIEFGATDYRAWHSVNSPGNLEIGTYSTSGSYPDFQLTGTVKENQRKPLEVFGSDPGDSNAFSVRFESRDRMVWNSKYAFTRD